MRIIRLLRAIGITILVLASFMISFTFSPLIALIKWLFFKIRVRDAYVRESYVTVLKRVMEFLYSILDDLGWEWRHFE